ncbi:MAG: ankyrin repeat domain-containing protein [Limisphaerales bacterium]
MKTNVEHSRLAAYPLTRLPLSTLLLVLICCTIPIQAATNDLSLLLQKGLFEEEANHNLEAAQKAYESVVTEFDKDRKLAATAVFRLGEVYRKQGKTNEANAQYGRVVREFSDQKVLAEMSAKHLPTKTIARSAFTVQRTPSPTAVVETTSEEAEEIRRIEALIRNSPDLINAVNTRLSSGENTDVGTPLHKAAKDGHFEVVKFLLASGANIELVTMLGDSPLYLAAQAGHNSIVELLLSRGANIGGKNRTGSTALHVASENGFRTIVETLLKNGADPNATTQRDETPLYLAAARGQREIVELLIKHKADVNAKSKHGETPLHRAVTRDLDTAKLLINKGADVNAVNVNKWSPLWQVLESGGGQKTVRLLLENGADAQHSINGYTLLHHAAFKGRVEIIPLLVEAGADPNAPPEGEIPTPLMTAVRQTQQEAVVALVTAKADLNATNNAGRTALHLSLLIQPPPGSGVGGIDIAKMLVSAGANLNIKDNEGRTPIFYALALNPLGPDRKQLEFIELILKHGADPNAMDNQELTPLAYVKSKMQSSLRRQEPPHWSDVAELLKKYGANENLQRHTRIAVVRSTANLHHVVFSKNTNSNNQFTLFEAIIEAYSTSIPGNQSASLPFPDFANLQIRRLENGKEKIIPVNVAEALDAGDCTKDIPLQWGDLIEIPALDYRIHEQWKWPSHWAANLKICSRRRVEVIVKGTRTPFIIQSQLNVSTIGTGKPAITTDAPSAEVLSHKWSTYLVQNSGLLLASSDVTRIKVRRTNPRTGETAEFEVNTQINSPPNDLWLMEGDVIEIPDRDPNAPQTQSATGRSIPTKILNVPQPIAPTPLNSP